MATSESKEWLVIIPDFEGSEKLRPSLGKQHVAEMEPFRGSTWLSGGMLQNDERSRVVGNVIIAVSTSKEELLSELEKDVYAKQGVWDLSKVEIKPMKSLFRVST